MLTHEFETYVDPSSYMVRVASSPVGQAYKTLGLTQLQLRSGASVLDLGCGPGVDLVSYAETAGVNATVVGVDQDETAVEDARRRTADLPQVQVQQGDIAALGWPDESFDAVHTDRVLQHVRDVTSALAEAVRVLKVGGRAVFAEPDWRTLVIDHPEHRLSEAFTRYVVEHKVHNARLGAQSPLSAMAGLSLETVLPITSVYNDLAAADQVLGFSLVMSRPVAQALSQMTNVDDGSPSCRPARSSPRSPCSWWWAPKSAPSRGGEVRKRRPGGVVRCGSADSAGW